MTIDQKVEAYRMRLEGHSLQEIGDKFGVTRERIRQILSCREKVRSTSRCNYSSWVFPGIAEYAKSHRLSLRGLSKKAGMPFSTVYNIISGKSVPSKSAIDKILESTGMTYEEAFRARETEAGS